MVVNYTLQWHTGCGAGTCKLYSALGLYTGCRGGSDGRRGSLYSTLAVHRLYSPVVWTTGGNIIHKAGAELLKAKNMAPQRDKLRENMLHGYRFMGRNRGLDRGRGRIR